MEPDKRLPENAGTRDRIDQLREELHQEVVDLRHEREADHGAFAKNMKIAIAVLTIGLLIGGWLAKHQNDERVKQIARESKARSSQINAERRKVTIFNCLTTNNRHDDTVRKLDIGLLSQLVPEKDRIKHSIQLSRLSLIQLERRVSDVSRVAVNTRKNDINTKRQLRSTHDFTLLLLDALAPVHANCTEYADSVLKRGRA